MTLVFRDAVRVPGLLSLSRLPLGLVFPLVWSQPTEAIGVIAAAATTDVLDGWCARRFDAATETGAALDPMMDKTFALLVVGTLLAVRAVTPAEAVLLSTREILELPLVAYTFARRIRTTQRANLAGKVTTVLQFAAVLAVLANSPHRKLAIAATAVTGVVAGAVYWARAIKIATPAQRRE
ncbi:MAG TPA: CDP-alcohol phosphatidyltransferase family protein [Polyangiaceae bacterium]|jgi:phosphatidylglycerophosphate synthase